MAPPLRPIHSSYFDFCGLPHSTLIPLDFTRISLRIACDFDVSLGASSINGAELRPNGWWLIFDLGEEAGPFGSLDDARAFMDYVELQQQALAKEAQTPTQTQTQNQGDAVARPKVDPGLSG